MKNESLAVHGKARAVQLIINSLLYGRNENIPSIHPEFSRESIFTNLVEKNFPRTLRILVNVSFQFCLAAEFIGQDGAILPEDQPVKLQESREG